MAINIPIKILTDSYFISSVEDRDRDGFLSPGDKIHDRDDITLNLSHLENPGSLADALEYVTRLDRIVITADDGFIVYSGPGASSGQVSGIIDINRISTIPFSRQDYEEKSIRDLRNRIQTRVTACNQKKGPQREHCLEERKLEEDQLISSAQKYNDSLGIWNAQKREFLAEFQSEQLSTQSVREYLSALKDLELNLRKHERLSREYLD